MDAESDESELESAVQEEDNKDKGKVERSTTDVDNSGCVEVVASAVDIKGAIVVDSLEDEICVDARVREDESDEKEEDKAVSGRERSRNAVES